MTRTVDFALLTVRPQMPKEPATKKTRKAPADKPAPRGKAKKDPNAPKRALSAYMFFSQDWRERIKAENPDAGFGELPYSMYPLHSSDNGAGEVGKLLGAKWKELDDSEKKPYIEQAARDKARAEEEKANYDVGLLAPILATMLTQYTRARPMVVMTTTMSDDLSHMSILHVPRLLLNILRSYSLSSLTAGNKRIQARSQPTQQPRYKLKTHFIARTPPIQSKTNGEQRGRLNSGYTSSSACSRLNEEKQDSAVPDSQRSSWTSFIKSIASLKGDLSSLTAPPFILSPISLTEFPAYWCERPELFAAIADGKTAEDRALRVLKWFISTLKGQYTTRNESMGSEKKPLNPVLGELFYGYWPDDKGRGRTDLVVEQVSHHPPITAYYISNESKGISLQGHNAQKTSFSAASIIVKQIGHAILTLDLPSGEKETYLITLPRLVIAGLLVGSPYIELSEASYIASSSGYLSTIEYSGKGYFTGKAHTFKATVTNPELAAAYPLYTYEGQWNSVSHDKKTGVEFTDVTIPKEEVTVAPIDTQSDFETRKLWKKVADGIRTGDFETASREKSKIENEQRQRRRDELAAGEKWQLKHFERIESDPEYERLGKLYKAVPPIEDCYIFQHNAPPFGPKDAESQ
ncbi:hypothetical protein M0805_003725 [Coniferiporia weirii]|nr:hypothetical protein M0805_003725 [Coniferiporia weirii]